VDEHYKMAHRGVTVSSKNRNRRVLMSFVILAAEIVLEGVLSGAQQTQSVPTSLPRVGPQRRQIGSGDNRQNNFLRQVVSDPVEAVDPGDHQPDSGDTALWEKNK
jgi:hypothetical protein